MVIYLVQPSTLDKRQVADSIEDAPVNDDDDEENGPYQLA
jgi:hypothetical protein